MMYPPKVTETFSRNSEKLLYLAVVAGAVILISLGVWLEGIIVNAAEQNARMYQTALQVSDDNQLNYSIDTKQNNVIAQVTVNAVDLVKFPEMNKAFSRVTKTEEEYTEHTREVCSYDDEGNEEECHDESYYEWDFVQQWDESAKQVDMAGRKYPIDLFALRTHPVDAKDIIDGETGEYVIVEADHFLDIDIFDDADEGDIRYSYDVLELPQAGTVFLNVSETVRPVFGNKVELLPNSPDELVKNAQNAARVQSIVFTVFWSILVLAELGFLGYAVYRAHE